MGNRNRTFEFRNLDRGALAGFLTAGLVLIAQAAHASSISEVDRHLYAQRLSATRSSYFKVVTNSDETADRQAHEALAALETAYPGDPVAKAYHGSLQLLDVAHSWAIWNLRKQATGGLAMMDEAVTQAPDEPEARFIRAATNWHLPGFYHRRAQCEADFAVLSSRSERDVREDKLPPEFAAAALNYWGQILVDRNDSEGARTAFSAAIRVAPKSPAGLDAGRRLTRLQ